MKETFTLVDVIACSWCYLIYLLPTHVRLIFGGLAVSLPALFCGRDRFVWCARSITVFFLALLFTGFLANLFWNILIFGKYYWQYDYAGYECSPFGLLIYEDVQNPARYFRGTHEKTIRNWHSTYLLLSWTGAYVVSLFINKALDRKKEKANN